MGIAAQPDFFRLLDILGVGVIERSATICAFDPASGQRGVTVLPPPFLINGHGWLKGIHDLGKATALFQLLLHGRKLLERGDNVTTVEEAIAQLHNTQVRSQQGCREGREWGVRGARTEGD